MKKMLSVLVLAAMLLSALAITASAAEYDYVNQADYYEHEAVKIGRASCRERVCLSV